MGSEALPDHVERQVLAFIAFGQRDPCGILRGILGGHRPWSGYNVPMLAWQRDCRARGGA